MSQYKLLLLAVSLAAGLSSGCKTESGVAMRMVLPPGAPVMDIPKDKAFLMASPVSQPMPAFPTGALKRSAVNICVEIVVSESGAVSSAVPIYGLPDCLLGQAEVDQQFVASTIEAVKRWQFLAAAICTFPPGAPKSDDCSGLDVVVSPVAIRLSYVFLFQRGRVTARSGRA